METRLTRQEGLWVKYQLALHKSSIAIVAKEAGCVYSMVTHFLAGRKGSERVKAALLKILDYSDIEALRAAARQGAA